MSSVQNYVFDTNTSDDGSVSGKFIFDVYVAVTSVTIIQDDQQKAGKRGQYTILSGSTVCNPKDEYDLLRGMTEAVKKAVFHGFPGRFYLRNREVMKWAWRAWRIIAKDLK